MSNIYHDLILEHYKNPRNFGELPNADISIREENVGCGDEIEIQLQVTSDPPATPKRSFGGRGKRQVKAIRWNGRGCAIATAAASMLSERMESGKWKVERLKKITDQDMIKMLGGDISPSRMKCATLALRALQEAIGKLKMNDATI